MKQLKLFEWAIVLQPKYDKDGEKTEEGKLIERGETLAIDQEQATLVAGRKIPEELMDKLERVTLVVRPF